MDPIEEPVEVNQAAPQETTPPPAAPIGSLRVCKEEEMDGDTAYEPPISEGQSVDESVDTVETSHSVEVRRSARKSLPPVKYGSKADAKPSKAGSKPHDSSAKGKRRRPSLSVSRPVKYEDAMEEMDEEEEEVVQTIMKKPRLNSTEKIKSDNSTSGVIRLEVEHASKLKDRSKFSATIDVGGLPWRARVFKESSEERNDEVRIQLYTLYSKSPLWNLHVKADYIIVNSDSHRNVKETHEKKYEDDESLGCIFDEVTWEQLMDENQGFIKDDTITFEIHVDILKIPGTRANPPIDFTDPNVLRHDVALTIGGEKVYVNKDNHMDNEQVRVVRGQEEEEKKTDEQRRAGARLEEEQYGYAGVAYHANKESQNDLLADDNRFGFIVMDGNGCLFGTLQGNTRKVLYKFTVDLPGRFARLRMEKRHNYVRKVAETAAMMYIKNDKVSVAGLILAGSADFKTELGQSDMFDQRLQAKMIKTVDISYGGENGFNQAIELSADALANVKFIQEKKLIGAYFDEISQDSGKCVIGATLTLNALKMRVIKTLICWENLDIMRYKLKNGSTGEETVVTLRPDEAKNFTDPDTQTELEVVESMPLLEWLANSYKGFGAALEIVTDKSQEGAQFVKGFGGIGGLLRYHMPFGLTFLRCDFPEEEEFDLDDY